MLQLIQDEEMLRINSRDDGERQYLHFVTESNFEESIEEDLWEGKIKVLRDQMKKLDNSVIKLEKETKKEIRDQSKALEAKMTEQSKALETKMKEQIESLFDKIVKALKVE